MPEYTWTITPERQLRVTVQEEPLAVTLWQADNTTARDFRLDVIGKAWTSSPLLLQKGENGELVYETKVTPPEQGWRAFFVELVFKDDAAKTLTLTTEVSVLPNTLPYADRTTTGK
jgi:PhoPQ-activated pathogenicity-related protein